MTRHTFVATPNNGKCSSCGELRSNSIHDWKNEEVMGQKHKVPLRVGWLTEVGMLDDAAKVLGHSIVPFSAHSRGVTMIYKGGREYDLRWDEYFMFTVAQLLELNFESGDFKYCPSCGKLQVDCTQDFPSMADLDAHMGTYPGPEKG